MYKIAIVEDNHAILAMYKMKLELAGYEVVTAANGQDGLALLKSETPALLLLDIKLPYMNGDELLEKVRATKWGASIRVIILTNVSKDEAPMSLRLLNVDRYVVKAHHTPSQVLGIVEEILN